MTKKRKLKAAATVTPPQAELIEDVPPRTFEKIPILGKLKCAFIFTLSRLLN